ncbi:peroxidase family protein [Rhizohabitans arisaemae]|uniref:peroxidase family protein n=1 Tax=Rhizohabitans arisaemae TaxID=2720610 RepID=UPI0024B21E5B|nr:peroxidase family protein [Rhizohabitans arisaemae]
MAVGRPPEAADGTAETGTRPPATETLRRLVKPREWHELPTPLAIVRLAAMRDGLREHNLHDTVGAGGEGDRKPSGRPRPRHRTYDGSGYDAYDEDMGRAGTRFDRNAPLEMTFPDAGRMMSPSPREISRRLLRRRAFQPAPSLNLLAAAWIQFQNHDWFSHGDNHEAQPLEVGLRDDDDWHERPMRVRRTRPDPVSHTRSDRPPTYENTVTHWWDGSQVYGSSEERCRRLRTGEDGKLILEDGRLPQDDRPGLDGIDLTGFSDNYWVGLSMLHTLFAKEHNAVCDRLRAAYPSWGDEELFQTARLVNAAVMAKIHTVEWTPGILSHPATVAAMNVNWSGLAGPRFRRRYGRVGDGEVISGILGSPMNHHGAPYSITEEFVTCYRLHPLIPDEYEIRSNRRGELVDRVDFAPIQGAGTRDAVTRYGMSDLFYSFGVAHPGAITLHNHPDALRNLVRISGEHLDLGTVDILRDRERGVPRYNAFRTMLRKPPVRDFHGLTPNAVWAKEIEEIYDGQIDQVDTMIGMYAEEPPKGFGFSETAFRIFVLMASRRLKSDPFFTDHYTPEVYTPEGLEWVENTGMLDVLHRHHPELAPALAGVGNAFSPWRRLR